MNKKLILIIGIILIYLIVSSIIPPIGQVTANVGP